MKRIVEVGLIDPNQGDQQIPCRYEADGFIYILLRENKMEKYPRNTPPEQMQQEMSITLSYKKPLIRYEYEDDISINTIIDQETKEVVEIFWSRYPLCNVNGNPVPNYTKVAHLNVQDLFQKSEIDYEKWRLMCKTATIIDGMDSARLRDVAYYYGVRPNQMKRSEIILLLCNFTNGILHNTIINGESEFINTWETKDDYTREVTIVLKKAVDYGIIITKAEGGTTNYYLNQTRMGSSYGDMIDFVRRDENIYNNNIKREVENTDNAHLSSFDKQIKAGDDIKSLATTYNKTPEQLIKLRTEAYQLQSQGYIKNDIVVDELDAQKLEDTIKQATKAKKIRALA